MLTHISIRQFTVVDSLDIEFAAGMTVLTGETGAGKSIILDALGLCLGDRADTGLIRPGSERAEISASFDLDRIPHARTWLAERELDSGGDCLLRRTLSREGRSRAYINGRPATLEDCAALGELLIDIHGQHAHQSLLRRGYQRALLDSFADADADSDKVRTRALAWKDLDARLTALRSSHQDQADREQLLRYQVQELEELALASGEVKRLEEEQQRLANADTIQREAATGIRESETAEASLSAALRALDPTLHTGETLQGVRDLLDSAAIQTNEARLELERYLATAESDPARLAEVEARLDRIYTLARKHRVESEALPAEHERLEAELSALDTSDERLDALEKQRDAELQAYTAAAKLLTKKRKEAASRLEKDVARLLVKLSMRGTQFRVVFSPRGEEWPHVNGAEDVELRIATQPGAEAQPLGRVASGGELSRISLAIQVATAGKASVPSMVFDEVDVGIGGGVAEVVGRLLATMGKQAQILCVTHLPQVAAQGRHHLRVAKRGRGAKLASELTQLTENERVEEIARMLGGVKMTDSTLAHAREMLATAS